MDDPLEKDWHAVIKAAPRDLARKRFRSRRDMICSQNETYIIRDDEYVIWVRNEIP